MVHQRVVVSVFKKWLSLVGLCSLIYCHPATSDSDVELKETCLSTHFPVRPIWHQAINSLVTSIRERITSAHQQRKKVIYVSLPLTSSNGGIKAFNKDIGLLMKTELLEHYGRHRVEVILPGQEETKLAQISGMPPTGGEYLYMWTQILAGEDCTGDVDWVYFMDLHDVHRLLRLPEKSKKETLEYMLKSLAASQPEIYYETATTPKLKEAFLEYYLKHYSVMNSKGARDEWNIIQRLSKKNPNKKIRQHFSKKWTLQIKQLVPKGYEYTDIKSSHPPLKEKMMTEL